MSENHSETNGEISVAARSIAEAVSEVIVGGTETIHLVLVALFAKGHILLEDVPGTGKTSLIMSIASKLDYSIYIIPFTASLDDVSFTEALSNIPEKSILIMEDVDSLFVKRDNKSTGLTFSGMINALDGLTIRDGLITFLTTNHIENIDEALLRPGRVDYHMEFTYTTDEQKRLMCKSFIPDISDDDLDKFIDASKSIKITTAILQYV